MRTVLANAVASSVLAALAVLPASAFEVGRADFAYVSELAAKGFEPFAASGVGKAIFGMKKGGDMHLCFLADSKTLQAERREKLLAHIQGSSTNRDMPNIPVVCITIR